MKRPASLRAKPEKTTFSHDLALDLRKYFAQKLEAAKAASPCARVIWPTVTHWCVRAGVNHSTLHSWARRHEAVKEALDFCADIRRQMAAMELNCVIFDSEVEL